MQNDLNLYKLIVRLVGVISSILTIMFFSKNLYFLLNYANHEGYRFGVFGYPTPINYSIFYTIFLGITLYGFIEIIRIKVRGWVLIQVLCISGFSTLALAQILLPSQYLTISYFFLSISMIFLFIFLNVKQIKSLFNLPKLGARIAMVGGGVLILGLVSLFNFIILNKIYF